MPPSRPTQQEINDHVRALRRRIGHNIHTLRVTKRLTLKKCAALSGLTPETLDRFEIGGGEINLDHLAMLSQALNADISQFIKTAPERA